MQEERMFFISDLHLGHWRILDYSPSRLELVTHKTASLPKQLEEHDKELIKRWNQTVSANDIVWFLGDFALTNGAKTRDYIRRLNGRNRMVLGNHDQRSVQWYKEAGFEFVSPYPAILKKRFVLSHAPVAVGGSFFNIHGHTHRSPICPERANARCVCCEYTGFKPIELEIFNQTAERNCYERSSRD